MAVSDSGRRTPANLIAAATATAQNQRKTDVLLAMRETFERTDTLANYVNNRFQGRTQVMAYELKRNKTTFTRKSDWDGSSTQFDAQTPDQLEFESLELPWTKDRELYRTMAPQQDIVESQIDPVMVLAEGLANKIAHEIDEDIYKLIRDYNKASVTYDFATPSTRSQYVLTGLNDANNYLADDQQKTGTKPIIYNLFRAIRSKLISANQADPEVSRRALPYNVLMHPDVENELIDELGARGVDSLILQEIGGTGRRSIYGFLNIHASALAVPIQVNVTTGATVQSGGKMAYPIYIWRPDAVTLAVRDVMERTDQPLGPGNNSMNYQTAYTKQQLLAVDDDRDLWMGFVRHEA